MFNLLHIADVHLGAVPYGIRARGEDIDHCLNAVAQRLSGDWDALIISGDLFDHAQVNPVDHLSLMSLLNAATARHVPVYWIEGDHDSVRRDRVRRDGSTWPEVFAQSYFVQPEILQEDGLPVSYTLEKEGHQPLTICPINWRPRTEIKEMMSRIPQGFCDVMIMHQSLEGVVPAIGNPELDVADIDGKAAYFALGDLHVEYLATLPSGSVASYPGPPEWLATDQAIHTGAWGIIFDEEGRYLESTRYPTPSRNYVPIMIGNEAIVDLRTLLPGVASVASNAPVQTEVGSPGNSLVVLGGDFPPTQHRYFFDIRYFHSPTSDRRELAQSLERHLRSRFPECLTRTGQVPSVDSADQFDEEGAAEVGEGEEAAALTMGEAIRQQCADEEDPQILEIALSIWENPETAQSIIEQQYETTQVTG